MSKTKTKTTQDNRLYLRISSELKVLIARAAKKEKHWSEGAWVRATLEARARELLRK